MTQGPSAESLLQTEPENAPSRAVLSAEGPFFRREPPADRARERSLARVSAEEPVREMSETRLAAVSGIGLAALPCLSGGADVTDRAHPMRDRHAPLPDPSST